MLLEGVYSKLHEIMSTTMCQRTDDLHTLDTNIDLRSWKETQQTVIVSHQNSAVCSSESPLES